MYFKKINEQNYERVFRFIINKLKQFDSLEYNLKKHIFNEYKLFLYYVALTLNKGFELMYLL